VQTLLVLVAAGNVLFSLASFFFFSSSLHAANLAVATDTEDLAGFPTRLGYVWLEAGHMWLVPNMDLTTSKIAQKVHLQRQSPLVGTLAALGDWLPMCYRVCDYLRRTQNFVTEHPPGQAVMNSGINFKGFIGLHTVPPPARENSYGSDRNNLCSCYEFTLPFSYLHPSV
jgi:hypothetical protein